MLVFYYVDENSSTATLAAKRSAGVAPEVNVKNSLGVDDKGCRQGNHPGFETYAKVTKIPKRVSVTPQKGLMSSKQIIFLKS